MTIKKICFQLFFLAFICNTAFAYQPTWQDLSYFINTQYKNLRRATLDLDIEIFEKNSDQPTATYRRIVYWTPQLKAMKTLNRANKLVDFYYEESGHSMRLQNQKLLYDVPKILPPYLRLVHPKQIEQNFHNLQITGREVSTVFDDKDGASFKVGNARNFLLIDPQTLLPKQLVYGVWQDQQISTIKIKFSDLVKARILYPRHVNYFYNDELFQRVTLKQISIKKRIPKAQLQLQAKKLAQKNIPFHIDYTR